LGRDDGSAGDGTVHPRIPGGLPLFERSALLQFLLSPRLIPVGEEFLAVECGPLDHESNHPGRQAAGEDGQIANIDQSNLATVFCVEMRRVMIVKEHLDDDAEKRLISGMGCLVAQGGEDVFRLPSRCFEVQGVRAEIDFVLPYKLTE